VKQHISVESWGKVVKQHVASHCSVRFGSQSSGINCKLVALPLTNGPAPAAAAALGAFCSLHQFSLPPLADLASLEGHLKHLFRSKNVIYALLVKGDSCYMV
jgi:hypothetical protein